MQKGKSLVDQLVDQSRQRYMEADEKQVQVKPFDLPDPVGSVGGAEIPLPEGPKQEAPASPSTKPTPATPPGANSDVVKIIYEAAKKHGVDPARLLALAYHETGGTLDVMATNPNSGAKGLFQALPAWAKQYGIEGKEYNPTEAADAAARSLLGTKGTTNPYVSYLVHNQGRAGAEAILRAAAGEAPLPAKIKRNMLAQPGFKGREVSDEDLAKSFLTTQRKQFMKHYDRASKQFQQQAADDAYLSRTSGGIDWDGLVGRATMQAQQHAAASVPIGQPPPRTTWGGKL